MWSNDLLRRVGCGFRSICAVVCVCGPGLVADAAPPVSPVLAPEYCFSSSGPTVSQGWVSAGDVLNVQYPHPRVVLQGAALGLSAFDEMDALSAAHELLPPGQEFILLFSVTSGTVGLAEPAAELVAAGVPYNVVDQALRNQVPGDEFGSTELFTVNGTVSQPDGGVSYNNFLTRNNFDEGGTSHAALPETSGETVVPVGTAEDNVAASARLPHMSDGTLANLYFSLTAGSPALPTLLGSNASGATILFAVHPSLQACCLLDGTCQIMPARDCMSAGGMPRGRGSGCEQCVGLRLGEEGACCFDGESCEIVPAHDCMVAGGYFLGIASTCDSCDSASPGDRVGACCYPNGTCELLLGHECMLAEGVFLGSNTTCEMCDTLPPPDDGPCCLGAGGCEILTFEDCGSADGFPLGPGAACDMCQVYAVSVFATYEELGLQQQDELDGMIVFDLDGDRHFNGDDQVLFSLSASSESLASIPGASSLGAGADVFVARPGQPAALFAAAAELGLGAPSDELDALDLLCVESSRGRLATEHGIRRVRGDLNCDGLTNAFDIDAFVLALTSATGYVAGHPQCDSGLADINGDGRVNVFDIDPFVLLLVGRN